MTEGNQATCQHLTTKIHSMFTASFFYYFWLSFHKNVYLLQDKTFYASSYRGKVETNVHID